MLAACRVYSRAQTGDLGAVQRQDLDVQVLPGPLAHGLEHGHTRRHLGIVPQRHGQHPVGVALLGRTLLRSAVDNDGNVAAVGVVEGATDRRAWSVEPVGVEEQAVVHGVGDVARRRRVHAVLQVQERLDALQVLAADDEAFEQRRLEARLRTLRQHCRR